jgi:hypothetical protein
VLFCRSKKLGEDGTTLILDENAAIAGAAGGSSSGAMRHEVVVHAGHDEEHDDHEGLDEASLREHEEVTKVKVSAISSLHCVYFTGLQRFPTVYDGVVSAQYDSS